MVATIALHFELRVDEARAELARQQDRLEPQDLIFIDEAGCHPGMGPRRGWAPVGQALFGAEQVYARGQHISKIGAMSLDGMMATMTTRGGVGSKEFRTFIEQRLAPHLRPGHIVCLAQSQCAGATTHPAVRGALAFSSTLQPRF